MSVSVTKFTHACVRISGPDGILVIDPGIWTERAVLAGADAVLVTHEHNDHLDPELIDPFEGPVYGPDSLAAGAVFEAAGYRVRAVGGRHAVIHDGKPDVPNLGYLIDLPTGTLYHPGDALHVPDEPVDTLLVPAQASWLKTGEAIAFGLAVKPGRAFAIHDGQINERGIAGTNGWFSRTLGEAYRYLAPGESL